MSTILIIDDDKDIREVFADALEDAGYTVHQARNGKEGLQRIEALAPDLVIVDVFMPEMDGVETILQMKKNENDTKIIAVSGGGFSQNFQFLEVAETLGADKLLHKPVLPNELIECVGEFVKP